MDRADDKLRQLTGYCLRRATHSAMSRVSQVFARHGLRRTTFSALTLIVETPGLRQSQLAEAIAVERPNLVQIVDELEAAGLVRRETAKGDRRAYALQATARGRRIQAEAMRQVRLFETKLTRGLTGRQLAALHDALQRIEDNATSFEESDEPQVS